MAVDRELEQPQALFRESEPGIWEAHPVDVDAMTPEERAEMDARAERLQGLIGRFRPGNL